jgi:flavin-binding protein dodecin
MSVAKVTEIISSSKKSFENGKIAEYRVTMRVTFVIKD